MGADNQKLSTEEFIRRAKSTHGDRYDYSKVVYVGAHIKVCITCREHGDFWQQPCAHSSGQGCPVCGRKKSNDKRRLTKELFIEKAKKVHGDKYLYDKVELFSSSDKVCVTCPEHGDFWQEAHSHLAGHGCPICAREKFSYAMTYTTEEFVERANKKHNNKYSYKKTEYVQSNIKVCVTCQKHGDFMIEPSAHLQGVGCPMCWEERRGKGRIKKLQEFIKEAKKIHGDKYDYSLITNKNYIDTKHKVPIICKEHGIFWQTPKNHLRGYGCPHCPPSTISIGEDTVGKFLKSKNIEYIPQYKFNNDTGISDNKTFVVDFYIKRNNTIIEYNGEQHYCPTGYWGGQEKLLKTQKRDKALSEYCQNHGIRLLTIPYWDLKNIETILEKELNINNIKT